MNYDFLSTSERDAIAASCLYEHLRPLGLVQIKPRIWVDGSEPPVRCMFELQLLKGASLKACWGFSLDFVPHIARHQHAPWSRSDNGY
jgi:hypothetical protein